MPITGGARAIAKKTIHTLKKKKKLRPNQYDPLPIPSGEYISAVTAVNAPREIHTNHRNLLVLSRSPACGP